MKCCYITKKGPCNYKGKKEFPANLFINIHSFCKIHYNQLLKCTNLHLVNQFYTAIAEQVYVSAEEDQTQGGEDTILV